MIKTDWNPLLYNDKHSFVYEYGSSLVKLLDPQSGERILDVGCGSGQLTYELAQTGATVVGIDSSPQMINAAKSNFPEMDFFVMDAAEFYFDQPFDAIFSNATLHWVLDKEGAARSIYRALKRGGRFTAEFGGKGNVQTIVTHLRQALTLNGLAENAARDVWYFPSVGEYASLLEQCGFTVRMAQHYDRPTELSDRAHGIEDWLDMFAGPYLAGLSTQDKNRVKEQVQEMVKEILFQNGKWYADYKRLRVVATKQ